MKSMRVAERKLASYLNVKHTLMTSKGRNAFIIALKALGISDGDKVILPSFLCNILVKSVEFCGARPVFADVDPLTFNIDPQEIKKNITRNSKAILVIHCYGQPADMDELLEIASENNVPVIEDAAQSLGAKYHRKKVGSLGRFSIFSFSKNMNCSSGGALATNSDDLMSKARETLQNLSASEPATSHLKRSIQRVGQSFERGIKLLFSYSPALSVARKLGYSRQDTIPEIFGAEDYIANEVIRGMDSIDQKNDTRRKKARTLTDLITDLKIDAEPPSEKEDRTHVYYIYGLKVKERDKTLRELSKQFISCSLPWQCYHSPTAKELSRNLILFELSSDPDENDVRLIASALSSAFRNSLSNAV